MPDPLGDLGRFCAPAAWILVALRDRTRTPVGLSDDLALIGCRPVGPGTLYGAIARLEFGGLIEPARNGAGRAAYRLTASGAARLDPGGGVT